MNSDLLEPQLDRTESRHEHHPAVWEDDVTGCVLHVTKLRLVDGGEVFPRSPH